MRDFTQVIMSSKSDVFESQLLVLGQMVIYVLPLENFLL